jgi:nicotinic acid phosphoribosyltransferase
VHKDLDKKGHIEMAAFGMVESSKPIAVEVYAIEVSTVEKVHKEPGKRSHKDDAGHEERQAGEEENDSGQEEEKEKDSGHEERQSVEEGKKGRRKQLF